MTSILLRIYLNSELRTIYKFGCPLYSSIPDTDSDNDGSPDCIDLCPTDNNKIEPGLCGCGICDGGKNSLPCCYKSSEYSTKIINKETVMMNAYLDRVNKHSINAYFETFGEFQLTNGKFINKNSKYISYKFMLKKLKGNGNYKEQKVTYLKPNKISLTNLSSGRYNIKYKVVYTSKRGKTEETKYSARVTFDIP